ncbi:MAG TPA: PQQ-binding-like beta-propeller repeat protein [Anaeromyxobacter sp.]|nr:PQQ-binding-like beta-propeller repeat protein [Anaeromyxobacter sp.]
MLALALAVALGWSGENPEGLATRLPPAARSLFTVAWRRPLAPFDEQGLEEGGVAADLVTGLAVCGTRDGWLHAYRPDGSLAWEFKAGGAFPAPPAIDGGVVYAGSSDGRVYALSLSDGKLRWSYDAGEEMGTRPTVANGAVYVMSLQDTLVALDAGTGDWKWLHRREARGIDRGFTIRGAARALVHGDTVYGAYSDGFVAALDGNNGQVRWERLVAPSGEYTDVDGLWLDGDRLFAAAYSGAVLALDARSGAQVWSFALPLVTRVTGGPGVLFAESATQLFGISSTTGQPLWRAPLGGSPGAPPVLAGRWLLVPAQSGGLRFVDPANGQAIRSFDGGTGVSGEPAVVGGRAYVLSNGGILYALDLQ